MLFFNEKQGTHQVYIRMLHIYIHILLTDVREF